MNKKGYNMIANLFIYLFFILIVILFILLISMKRQEMQRNVNDQLIDSDARTVTLYLLNSPVTFEGVDMTFAELVQLFGEEQALIDGDDNTRKNYYTQRKFEDDNKYFYRLEDVMYPFVVNAYDSDKMPVPPSWEIILGRNSKRNYYVYIYPQVISVSSTSSNSYSAPIINYKESTVDVINEAKPNFITLPLMDGGSIEVMIISPFLLTDFES